MNTPLFILYNIENSPRGRMGDRGCNCPAEENPEEPLDDFLMDSDLGLILDSDGTFLIDP